MVIFTHCIRRRHVMRALIPVSLIEVGGQRVELAWWLLKNSSWLVIRAESGERKCLRIREDRRGRSIRSVAEGRGLKLRVLKGEKRPGRGRFPGRTHRGG